jgi:hypothetical protein
MMHLRKTYPRTTQFNSFAGWVIGASVAIGAIVFLSRHVYI